MFSLKAKQKRFSLYFLEENELYTQDLSGFCIILDNDTQKERFFIFFKKKKNNYLKKPQKERKKARSTYVPEA